VTVIYRECPNNTELCRHAFLFRVRMMTGTGGEKMAWYLVFFHVSLGRFDIERMRIVLANVGQLSAFKHEDELDRYISAKVTGVVRAMLLVPVHDDKRALAVFAAETLDAMKSDPDVAQRMSQRELESL